MDQGLKTFVEFTYRGDGTPEGVVKAPVGARYVNITGGAEWEKTTGLHLATGWIQVGVPVVDPTFTGTLTAGRLAATSATTEHQLTAGYTAAGYTTANVLLLSHGDSVGGCSALRCFGPGTTNEYSAFGCGGSFLANLYHCTYMEGSDEQGQGAGLPIRIIQRSNLVSATYQSFKRFEISNAAGGAMTFYSVGGTAQMVMTDGVLKLGTTTGTMQIQASTDTGFNTGGFKNLNSVGVADSMFAQASDNNLYILTSSGSGGNVLNILNSSGTSQFLFACATGILTANGGVKLGSSGTTVDLIVSATATLDFGSTAAGAVTDLTITVTGASVGDSVALGIPNGSVPASGSFSAWVSASNTVTVRYANNALVAAGDPASGTFRATVISH